MSSLVTYLTCSVRRNHKYVSEILGRVSTQGLRKSHQNSTAVAHHSTVEKKTFLILGVRLEHLVTRINTFVLHLL
jgi:hypothetical protein